MLSQFIKRYRTLFAIVLTVGIILSANSRMVSHSFIEVAQIIAEHNDEIEEHGHSHEDIIDILHAAHGHAHEIADHDHNIAFLPTLEKYFAIPPNGKNWLLMNSFVPDQRIYGLDRPPRV